MNYVAMVLKPKAMPMKPASHYIGHGLTKLYELVGEGRIKTVKSGRKRLVLVESLDEYIDSLSREEA